MELTDADVEAASGGDSRALTKVYESLAPRVRRYLWARGAEDAEGLTNEVFVTVLQRLPRIHGGEQGLVRFVFSVAHARYVDEVRCRVRRPLQLPYETEHDDRVAPAAEVTALEAAGLEGALRMLARLSEDQRAVVAMRVLGDLSLENTAQAMGRSVGAVKQLQRRGLLALRELVEEGENPRA